MYLNDFGLAFEALKCFSLASIFQAAAAAAAAAAAVVGSSGSGAGVYFINLFFIRATVQKARPFYNQKSLMG